jgi:NADH-quinone oxidoreductase subunit N
MLAYSSVGQAGYMLAGVVVATQLGVAATVFYLAVYLLMNMASFAVIVARERETGLGDSIDSVAGLGRERPWLAWPMTISMLALAGIPATAGFIGKFYLIDAAVAGGYTWLGVAIVIGSMISLGYYLPVIAAMWMREAPGAAPRPDRTPPAPSAPGGPLPALAGGSPELDVDGGLAPPGGGGARTAGLQPEVALVAILAGAATIFFGILPQPLFDLVHQAGNALGLF